jgi:predicted AAA+ superfamily ATPase
VNRALQPYSPRVIDSELTARLASAGAVVLQGPKACGKTFSARQAAASEVLLDVDTAARAAVAVDPDLVLDGPTPRLIDEWQVEPALWDHVRRAVDDRGLPGQFILTGSAVPADDITRHTGAGRIARLQMRPMSLFESGHSTGDISLARMLDSDAIRSPDSGQSVRSIVDRVCVGGWPAFQRLSVAEALLAVSAYLDEIRRTDINRVDGARRDPERAAKLLRSLARNVATTAAVTKLVADTAADDDGGEQLARNTVYDHLDALERLMIIEDQPAWAPHLRSRSQLRTGAKRLFVDPSLAVAALGASPERLLNDLNFFGFLFESLAIRDLRIYGQSADAHIFHYRDNTDLEVDAIVQTRDGRWAAFEIKLGGDDAIEYAAANLLRFAERVDTSKSGSPARLGVIVATGYGYVREDGIAVVPLGALKP